MKKEISMDDIMSDIKEVNRKVEEMLQGMAERIVEAKVPVVSSANIQNDVMLIVSPRLMAKIKGLIPEDAPGEMSKNEEKA